MSPYNSTTIIELHDNFNSGAQPEGALADSESFYSLVLANHTYNRLLWDEEDLARRKDVADSLIAQNKRNIDTFNQKRNDAIEKIDEYLISNIGIMPSEAARQHTETVGAIADRLSILSLKIKAMGIEAARSDAGIEHNQKCKLKLFVLNEQRDDLAAALDKLFIALLNRTVYYKVYRQFKMYNDPTLNPALYSMSREQQK